MRSPVDPVGEATRLLGVPLPPGREVGYARWQPSNHLSYFVAYLRFDATPDEFTELAHRLGLSPPGERDADRYLPAAWELPPELRLEWWNAAPGTPPGSAARAYGVNGWIVAKHENGTAYLIVTDAGHVEGTAGPA